MKTFLLRAFAALVIATGIGLIAQPHLLAQVQPVGSLVVNSTSISGGSTTNCLYITSTRKLGAAASCGTGPAADITVGTTTVTGASNGDILTKSGGFLSKTTPGTGVLTALGVNIGSAGAPVLFNGALGTPSSGTATNLTGTAAGLTAGTASAVAVGGITGLGTGVGTFLATPSSSNLASAVTDETGTGALVFGTNPVFTTSATLPSVAWASIPAAGNAGKVVRVSNIGTSGSLWMDDGTRWKPVSGCVTLKTMAAASSSIGNTDTLVFSYQLPAAVLQTGDRLNLRYSGAKSGTADTMVIVVRIGTAGTTADTAVGGLSAALGAANRSGGGFQEYRFDSTTTVLRLASAGGTTFANGAYSSAVAAAFPAAVTLGGGQSVSDSLFVSITIQSNGTTDTVQLMDAYLQLCTGAT